MKKKSLRALDWSTIVIHFLDIENSLEGSSKDLVDYFHFKYLTEVGTGRWTSPDYIRQKSCAEKLIKLYGFQFTIKMINVLFRKHGIILNKGFGEIHWSLGLLSSDKTGWILEKVFTEIAKEESLEKNDIIKNLLSKSRELWSVEDYDLYTKLIQEINNGKTKETSNK